MNLDNLSLFELFAQVEAIGAKYQSPEERAKFAKQMAVQTAEMAQQLGVGVAALGKKSWAVLTSDRAIALYKAILITIIVVLAATGMGLLEAAKQFWAKRGRNWAAMAYRTIRHQVKVSRAILTEWRRRMYDRALQEADGFIHVITVGFLDLS